MTYIAPHTKLLEPHLDLDRRIIHLTHYAGPEKLNAIRQNGLKPQISEPATYCLVGDEIPSVYEWLRDRAPVKFSYPLEKVRVRPVILRINSKSEAVDVRGIPFEEYLSGQILEPRFLWNLGIEFLVFEDIPPEHLQIEEAANPS